MRNIDTIGGGGDLPKEDILLGLLHAVERNPAVTQRSVARELGIALGLANTYLNRCIRKGLIKVGQIPARRYAYYLTPSGFAEKSRLTAEYLTHSFSFFRKARGECDAIFAKALANAQRRIVLIGAGDLAEIAALVAKDHPVDIAGVLAAPPDAAALLSSATPLKPIDAVVITAMANAQATFDMAVAAFGRRCVYAPELLRLRDSVPERP